MSFSLNNLFFIDSMLFINSSLDKLVKNVSDSDFKYLSESFIDEKLELVKKKGVYPYEYLDSFKKFKESKLPDNDNFFSSLKDCGISDQEYQRAVNLWKVFEIKNLGEYHNLYLKTDVLLLCDVFEKFINTCLEYYCLDPCHYFSSPGLSWDAMLKVTGIELEKINNIDVHLFMEKEMRGGISYISKRYSKSDKNKTIMYWDPNNLYGWAMTQNLPYCDFKFLSQKKFDSFDLKSISENSKVGYILEVNLEYCKELHDIHSDYPLVLICCLITVRLLLINMAKKLVELNKLIRNLGDKVEYVVHHRNLRYYLSLGIRLVRIHRILKFKQINWLKSYVNFNAEKRKQSGCKFDKHFLKLMINCVYGKSMENIRKTINVKLINDKRKYLKCVNKWSFMSQKIFDKSFVAIHCAKTVLTLNKPIYVGFRILELSKLLMYKFHYDYVLKTFNANLLLTDTDSLVYEINGGKDFLW